MSDIINVLVIEDEESHIELIKRALQKHEQYNLVFAGNIKEGKEFINSNQFCLILSDWRLPDGEGIDLIPIVKEKGNCPIILMTSYGNQELAVESMKQGVIDYVVKSPETFNRLHFTISRALKEWENILARQRAENSLRQSEMRYRAFVESSRDIISQFDIDGNFLFLNKAGCEALGTSKENIIGKNFSDFFTAESVEKQKEVNKKIIAEKKILDVQMSMPVNGVNKEFYVVCIPFMNISGDVESILGIIHDITELKRTEKALKLSEAKFREQSEILSNILHHIPNYIFWKDTNSVYRGCNENYASILGLESTEKITGKTDYDFSTKEIAEKLKKEDMEVMQTGIPILNVEDIFVNPKGVNIFVSKSIIPLKDSEGQKAGIIGMYNDITNRKISEEELRKLSRATEQSPALIVITDTNGNIEYVNPSFEKVTGYSLSEVKGNNPKILKSGYTHREIYSNLWQTIKAGYEWRGEFQNKKKSGELYWESASISAIKNEKGIITHFIAVKEDITVRKELEFDLKSAVDQAEESSHLKSSLLSNMSHELRTPLNGILGLSQILIEELSDSSLTAFAKKIYLAGKRLMVTLNSILDLSEIESNTTQLNYIKYDLPGHINYILTQYSYSAKEKGLYFEIDVIDKNILTWVDERLCNQILYNIVDNAVKYTEKGGIKIEISSESRGDNLYLKLCVEDSGIGISEKNIPLIFEEFRQVSEGYNRSFEGSGLGLTLVKKMLTLMKGDIEVKSEFGKGSKFIVYLPGILKSVEIPAAEETKPTEAEAVINRQPEVLLVEDNAINKEVIICYIENFCNVDGVSDANSAIENASQKQYDLVLMDINLGTGMDGIQATKIIKEIEGYEHIPFVALTGYAMSGDKERLLHEGLTHYLPKPFDKEDLQRLVKSILNISN